MVTSTRPPRKTTKTTAKKKTTTSTRASATAPKATTSTRSRATASKATAEKVAAAAPEPKVVAISQPVVGQEDMRKKELIDLVVERSDVKKKYAKPAVEAVLAILGETIESGRELTLPPMGKVRINRVEDKGAAKVYICKLRRPNPKDAAAEDSEDTGADS